MACSGVCSGKLGCQVMTDVIRSRISLGAYTTFGPTPRFGPAVRRDRQSDCAESYSDGDRNCQDGPEAQCLSAEWNALAC